jgi:hypothetical protein
MNSHITRQFREAFENLPKEIQERARKTYALWETNPSHPGLKFKQVQAHEQIYSVRIGIGWRALGIRDGDTMIWFWIGSHADFDKLVSKL